MTTPEDAVERARNAAAQARAEGAYDEPQARFSVKASDRADRERWLEWALIEPDPGEVYSTRRLGAPITWVKRGLLRALRQYHTQLTAQQSRFNVQVARQLALLSERVDRLEEEAGIGESPPRPERESR